MFSVCTLKAQNSAAARLLLVGVSAIALTAAGSAAHAQGQPTTGFYIGGAAGAAMARVEGYHSRLFAIQAEQAIVKAAPPELFVRNDANLEMRWEALYNRGYVVPNELFFVRNNSPVVPRVAVCRRS